MIMSKLIALAFIVLTPIFSYILGSLFKLRRYGILFTDTAFPLFAFEIILLSDKFFSNRFFPYYMICLSLLAIILTLRLLRKNHSFSYRRFLKFFWRTGSILSFLFYIFLVALLFTQH